MGKNNNKTESFEKTLFKAADKLRKNIDAAEYKHIVLGLIFLKYISDSFESLHNKFIEGKGDHQGADPEDADEHINEGLFLNDAHKNLMANYIFANPPLQKRLEHHVTVSSGAHE